MFKIGEQVFYVYTWTGYDYFESKVKESKIAFINEDVYKLEDDYETEKVFKTREEASEYENEIVARRDDSYKRRFAKHVISKNKEEIARLQREIDEQEAVLKEVGS